MIYRFEIVFVNQKTSEEKTVVYESTAYKYETRWIDTVEYAIEILKEMGYDWYIKEILNYLA